MNFNINFVLSSWVYGLFSYKYLKYFSWFSGWSFLTNHKSPYFSTLSKLYWGNCFCLLSKSELTSQEDLKASAKSGSTNTGIFLLEKTKEHVCKVLRRGETKITSRWRRSIHFFASEHCHYPCLVIGQSISFGLYFTSDMNSGIFDKIFH